jgi:two-component system response regulator VicR
MEGPSVAQKLLVVEDDRFVAQSLRRLFEAEGYCCSVVHSAGALRAELGEPGRAPDLVLLDLGLPDGDGFSVCRWLRGQSDLPVILLTARSDIVDKVVGLEVGADDYVTKPFDPRELVARVRAQLRRAHGARQAAAAQAIRVGDLVIDPERRDAFVAGKPAGLTQQEFTLLHLLGRHSGKALAAQWLFETLWGHEPYSGLKPLTVAVGRLRRKIEADPAQPRFLQTVYGFGYRLGDGEDGP